MLVFKEKRTMRCPDFRWKILSGSIRLEWQERVKTVLQSSNGKLQQEATLFEFSTQEGAKILEINQTSSTMPVLKLFKVNCGIHDIEVELNSWNTLEISEKIQNGLVLYQVKVNNDPVFRERDF